MDEYLREGIKNLKIAWDTGQRFTANVIIRSDRKDWRMSLDKIVAKGEDKTEDEVL